MVLNSGDLVSVDFPGVTGIKRRPAVILSWLTDKSQLISKKKLTQTGLERKRGVNCF